MSNGWEDGSIGDAMAEWPDEIDAMRAEIESLKRQCENVQAQFNDALHRSHGVRQSYTELIAEKDAEIARQSEARRCAESDLEYARRVSGNVVAGKDREIATLTRERDAQAAEIQQMIACVEASEATGSAAEADAEHQNIARQAAEARVERLATLLKRSLQWIPRNNASALDAEIREVLSEENE